MTLWGWRTAVEGGATGSLTVTLGLNTSGTGPAQLATAITGITLAPNADYSSDTQSFGVGAVTIGRASRTERASATAAVGGSEPATGRLAVVTRRASGA